MNRQVGYIASGCLLLLVILAGKSLIDKLGSGTHGRQATADVNVSTSLRGEKLFKDNCGACHSSYIENLSLYNIERRITNKQLLYDWIRDGDKVLRSGNKYFNDLYNKWNKAKMPSFPNLSDQEIEDILSYIQHYPRH